MIPILYTGDETRFINNGIGRLSDAVRCIVAEERNGIYELEIDYPITGVHFNDIQRGRIIAATHDDRHDLQPFVIYKRSVPDLNGVVTFYAHHISYKLNGVTVEPFTAGSVAAALQGIKQNSINTNPFEFWTDKTTTGDYTVSTPRNARAMLGGEENSILDVYGSGEYEFDRFTVKLHSSRGQDSDCEIRYGKNLTNLSQDIDSSGTFNAIVPYWADSEGNVMMLPEKILIYQGVEPKIAYLTDENLIVIRDENGDPIEIPYYDVDAAPMDLSDAFEERPTEEQLRQAARARFEAGEYWAPTENLTVDFVQLWQTEEYKDYAGLQRVRLCDTVSVYYPQVGIAAVKQKVVRTVYNVLLDRYDSIELGSIQTTLGEQIRETIMQEVPTTSMMDAAIQYATDLIRGGLGGYVVMTPGPNGYPQEILIMDEPNKDDAVNVWRFNQGGLGHSSTGYEGPFSDIALTADGKINASMITTGILNANVIRAGTITDEDGLNYWDLDSGQFVTKQGTIGPFTIQSDGLTYNYNNRLFDINEDGWEFFRRSYYSGYGYKNAGVGLAYDSNYTPILRFYSKYNTSGLEDKKVAGDIYTYNYFDDAVGLSILGGPLYGDRARLFLSEDTVEIATGTATYANQIYLVDDDVDINGNFGVSGTKSRRTKTNNYSERLLYCYETPTPLFGDIGEAKLDEEGICYIDLDDIFTETIAEQVEYQVFLQKEGEGDCWIAEKKPRYFVVQGTPGLKVAWELKAKQRDYETYRLEPSDRGLDEYEHASDPLTNTSAYIDEQEALLYG